MRYMGGKTRMKKYLAPIIDKARRPGQLAWDPFCGGLAMSEALSANGPVLASDASLPLISMYQAIRNGWTPPTELSEQAWTDAKSLPDTDPMKGFAGFGCSFNGMYFSRYIQPEARLEIKSGPSTGQSFNRRYHAAVGDVLRRQLPKVWRIEHCDFLSVEPWAVDAVLYLDPPYSGTVSYAGAAPFDHDLFVQRVRDWARYTHVFVSEYALPVGQLVFEMPAPKGCTMAKKTAVERLYYLGPNQ